MNIHSVKGMNDILPHETPLWNYIEKVGRGLFEEFGYQEIKIPILERTELFSRSIGETTDIVEKEMYTFRDKKGQSLTLRPEGTAPVVRAYLQHKVYSVEPYAKYYYWGPMFRYEKPQKGRTRQFHQFGIEVFGVKEPEIDAEIIHLLATFYHKIGLTDFEIQLNSLGCSSCRPAYVKKLRGYLVSQKKGLCPDCKRRVAKNPLRAFDCKQSSCKKVVSQAPRILDFLCQECEEHFSQLQLLLKALKVEFRVNPQMVRGIDYYTKTLFEFVHRSLGAQDAIGGGGRYDCLVSLFGGPDTPAIGYAGGLERLILLLKERVEKFKSELDLYLAPLGKEAKKIIFPLLPQIRLAGLKAEMDYGERGLKAQMKRADKFGAKHVLIVGDEEIKKGQAILRDMKTKEQKSLPLQGLVAEISREIKGEKY